MRSFWLLTSVRGYFSTGVLWCCYHIPKVVFHRRRRAVGKLLPDSMPAEKPKVKRCWNFFLGEVGGGEVVSTHSRSARRFHANKKAPCSSPASQTRRSFVMWPRSDASMCSSPSAAAAAAAATSTGRKRNTQIKETFRSQRESWSC